jgi:hypothetical protein
VIERANDISDDHSVLIFSTIFETSLIFIESARRNIPEDFNLQIKEVDVRLKDTANLV